MTPAQRAAIREIIATIQQSGIAFAYQKHRPLPEYGPDWALAEIERILAER